MDSSAPNQIGSYRIERELGRGGMGVVYLSHDDTLDRPVAIKALSEDVVNDPARLARFEREAKTLAQLNHANIAGIYGVEEQDGRRFLILEFVEGESLEERLDRGPLPVDDAIEFAIQIAAGIEAAHDAGVIHRDLKPGNVIITPEGVAKVLDFGLARIDEVTSSSSILSDGPTLTSPALQHSPSMPGVILGTAAYMSPEQARGRRVDKRTDIWSFGVVLYELLTGASPFVGETVSDSIGAVLHKGIDLERLPADTPAGVRRVLSRCVERDKKLRYRDIGDVRLELMHAEKESEYGASLTAVSSAKGTAVRMLAMVLLLLAVGASVWFAAVATHQEPLRTVRKFDLMTEAEGQMFSQANPRISPDGTRVAYILDKTIHVRHLDSFDSQPLVATDGALSLVWSPDSAWIAFATPSAMYKIPSQGGGVIELAQITGAGQHCGGWTTDDRIIATQSAGDGDEAIIAVSARGGLVTRLLESDNDTEIDFHEAVVIPETDVIIFVQHRRDGHLILQAYDGTSRVEIADMGEYSLFDPAWSPTGHVLFAHGFDPQSIWAVEFSPESMTVAGDPFLVLNKASSPSVSNDGTLVMMRGTRTPGGELVWLSRSGVVEAISGGFNLIQNPIVSPDGTKVLFTAGEAFNKADVWVRDLARGVNSRVTYYDDVAVGVGWSPDGREIMVMTPDLGDMSKSATHFIAADGSGETRPAINAMIMSVNKAFTTGAAMSDPFQQDRTMTLISLEDPTDQKTLRAAESTFQGFTLHPTGDVLAYTSAESGTQQVYCTRTPDGTGKWQVSIEQGNSPVWSVDGKSLYYWSDDTFKEVDVTIEPSPVFSTPRPVFDDATIDRDRLPDIHPTPDPDRFIAVLRNVEADDPATISVIENWFEEFRQD